MNALDIGLAFELRSDMRAPDDAPSDALEEYDSRETIDALAAALAALGHRPRLIGSGRAFVETLLARPPQLVFNLAEGRGSRSREAHVPALCEMLDVPCTHSDPLTMALTLDKALAKRVVHSAAVATAPFCVVQEVSEIARIELPFPLFVKPLAEGSSMGVRATSRVANHAALRTQVERCLSAYGAAVLIESYLPGVEVTVGIRGHGVDAEVFGIMEISPAEGAAADFIYGLEAKRDYQQRVRYHVPPRSLSYDEIRDAEGVALAAYCALGCRDIARVDVRFDAAQRANFLEVNPLPGLNPVTGDIVIMARAAGIEYQGLISGIVEEALKRHPALR